MKIMVDKEAKELLQKLCDMALKAGGLANLQGTLAILNGMELLPEIDKKDETTKE